MKKDIKSFTLDALKNEMVLIGAQPFRAKQIYSWLHQRKVDRFDEMTDLSLSLRKQLKEKYYINRLEIKRKLVSKLDGTVKYLFELNDAECIESVVMRYNHGNTICISSQVGCRMGCKFCASTIGGRVRNLTASEMLDQINTAEKDLGENISNVVMMGIGEPLDNFDNVIEFLTILSSKEGYNKSLRHLSLSTCGVCDKIDELADKKLQLTLSISLHAPNDGIRDQIMPINHKWNVHELISTCKRYIEKTGRRISFEYTMIHGVNDSDDCARQLAALLEGMICHVNLIPVNEVNETSFTKSEKARIINFSNILNSKGVTTTVRRKLGADIDAACGQLRRNETRD